MSTLPRGAHAPWFPAEILIHIFSYLPPTSASQATLYSACLVSRHWYHAAVPLLYRRPILSGSKLKPFAEALQSTKRRRSKVSDLGIFVRALDLSMLVHESSRSATARLLGKVKEGLEELVAPQANFSINSFATLAKCSGLRSLDLSFVSHLPMTGLFKSIKGLSGLRVLRLPRAMQWEPHVSEVLYRELDAHHPKLSIGRVLPESFISEFSPRISDFSCTYTSPQDYVLYLDLGLEIFGPHIRRLRVNRGRQGPQFHDSRINFYLYLRIFELCPCVEDLDVPHFFMCHTSELFDVIQAPASSRHPARFLHTLTLRSPFVGAEKIETVAIQVFDHIQDGTMPNLQNLTIWKSSWDATFDRMDEEDDLDILIEVLERLEKNWNDASSNGQPRAVEAGLMGEIEI